MNRMPLEGLGASGLELAFLHRVYRTTLIVMLVVGLLVWERFGPRATLGWMAGVSMGLLILVSVEWSVRRYFQPGTKPSGAMVLVSVLKLPIALGLMVLLWMAAQRRWISVPWVGIGFPLAGMVTLLKLVGQKLTGPRS